MHDLHVNLDSNIQIDVIFFDFEKAFDKLVPHRRRMHKLLLLNLDQFTFNKIENFLLLPKQFAVVNGAQANTAPVGRLDALTGAVPGKSSTEMERACRAALSNAVHSEKSRDCSHRMF